MSRAVNLVFVIFITCANVFSGYSATEVVEKQALLGERVVMRCHTDSDTNVVWTYGRSFNDRNYKDIVIEGEVINGNNEWFELNKPATGDFDLVIKKLTENRSGWYWCTEDNGQGDTHVYKVIVSTGEKHLSLKPDYQLTVHINNNCEPDQFYDVAEMMCKSKSSMGTPPSDRAMNHPDISRIASSDVTSLIAANVTLSTLLFFAFIVNIILGAVLLQIFLKRGINARNRLFRHDNLLTRVSTGITLASQYTGADASMASSSSERHSME